MVQLDASLGLRLLEFSGGFAKMSLSRFHRGRPSLYVFLYGTCAVETLSLALLRRFSRKCDDDRRNILAKETKRMGEFVMARQL